MTQCFSAHLCRGCLSLAKAVVEHRCLGLSYFGPPSIHVTTGPYQQSIYLEAAMPHYAGGHHTVEWKQLDLPGDKTHCVALRGAEHTVNKKPPND